MRCGRVRITPLHNSNLLYRIENMVCQPFRTATLVDNETIEGQIGEGCSPPADSGRCKVLTVEKLGVPTFASINLDSSSSPPPSSPTSSPSPTTPTPTPSSRRPPFCHLNYDHIHCENCSRCAYLCSEHHGCFCGKLIVEMASFCDVCFCEPAVRYTNPKEEEEKWTQT